MALSTKALGAIVGAGELLREEEQRRCEVDESNPDALPAFRRPRLLELKAAGGREGPYQEGAAGPRHAQVRQEEGAHPRAPRLRVSRERAFPGLARSAVAEARLLGRAFAERGRQAPKGPYAHFN